MNVTGVYRKCGEGKMKENIEKNWLQKRLGEGLRIGGICKHPFRQH
jgi:hypothetical protein